MNRKAFLTSEAERIVGTVREIRHAIHGHPEVGYEEIETGRRIAQTLETLGVSHRTGVAKTGIVGTVEGTNPGKTVLLRADMDALKKEEAVDPASRPYRSRNEGIMHACGHDGHVAILLGVASILHALRDRFAGTVRLVFQPAEEGGRGGEKMVKAGILRDPDVGAAFALHAWPELRCGSAGFQYGTSMAASSDFVLEMKGRSGHAAFPHLCIDPVPAAAEVITALQTIRSREISPLRGSVISVTILESGSKTEPGAGPGEDPLRPSQSNIVPQVVRLTGTSRALTLEDQGKQIARIGEIAKAVGSAHRVDVSMGLLKEYPPTIHDRAMTDLGARVATELLGPEKTVWVDEPTMGGEDFSYFLQQVPGSFFRLGTGRWRNRDELEKEPGLHSDTFDFNDDALVPGMILMAGVALEYLSSS
jgi:amidohydrolase